MNAAIIGLHGFMGVGKDTAYEELRERYGPRVQRRGFADPLKLSFARIIYPSATIGSALDFCNWFKSQGRLIVEDDVAGDKVSDISGRMVLQRYGTEAHREIFGDNFWVDTSLPPYDGMGHTQTIFGEDTITLFPDCRFVNEAERIREYGEVWEIVRPGFQGGAHASEKRLPDHLIDRTIINNGTRADLQKILARELENYLNGRQYDN